MSKAILVVAPAAGPEQPVAGRMKAFVDFFQAEGIRCHMHPSPASMRDLIDLVRLVYRERWRNVFVSMPPFRNWSLCFLPGVNTILDIRDGWSIGMRSGYGGTVPPRRMRAWIAQAIEQIAIRCSAATITCTPGLLRYHARKATRGKMFLIPNGFPSEELPLVEGLRNKIDKEPRSADEILFICAGKFSDYGRDKVRKIITDISKKFHDKTCIIKVYSQNIKSNEWVKEFINLNNLTNIVFMNNIGIKREAILEEIIRSDYGIAVIRDEDYDLGTKIFDYVMCGTPVFDYFEGEDIREFFRGHLDANHPDGAGISKFSRESAIKRSNKILDFIRESP